MYSKDLSIVARKMDVLRLLYLVIQEQVWPIHTLSFYIWGTKVSKYDKDFAVADHIQYCLKLPERLKRSLFIILKRGLVKENDLLLAFKSPMSPIPLQKKKKKKVLDWNQIKSSVSKLVYTGWFRS